MNQTIDKTDLVLEILKQIQHNVERLEDKMDRLESKVDHNYQDLKGQIEKLESKVDHNYQDLKGQIEKLESKVDHNYQKQQESIDALENMRISWRSKVIATSMGIGVGLSIIANIILARIAPHLYKIAETTPPSAPLA